MITFDDFKADGKLPVYQQILEYIKRGAVAGTVADGDELPSRRVLSARLGINPNTVQKAYSNLLGRGIIYAVPGKGSFISPDAREKLRNELEQKLASVEQMASQFAGAGIAKQDVLDAVERGYQSARIRSLNED